MLTYNGGNAIDHDSHGYSFATNYLSDLGRDIGYSGENNQVSFYSCLLYTSPSPRDGLLSRMPSSA